MKDVIALYNKKRSVFASGAAPCVPCAPAQDTAAPVQKMRPVAIVIPACAEYPDILDTFDSIEHSIECARGESGKIQICSGAAHAGDCTAASEDCTVICVVNNRTNASGEIKENNRTLIKAAVERGITVLDACSKGYELSEKEGVGTARRIGMDYALKNGADVIACMDADTLVSSEYICALHDFRLQCADALLCGKLPPAGAITGFTHQKAPDSDIQKAIDSYEFFIKGHGARLFKTKTPFYPYALGPSIVCSAWGYAASGGMPKLLSGEDFYFLQSLIKLNIQHAATAGQSTAAAAGQNDAPPFVFPELTCTVYPQARLSQRTLFGTGQKLGALVEARALAEANVLVGGSEKSLSAHRTEHEVGHSSDPAAEQVTPPTAKGGLLYPDFVYERIKDFIGLFYASADTADRNETFLSDCKSALPDVYDLLERERFPAVWEKMCLQNRKDRIGLERAFHIWFDGLKILRLIHFLTRA